ncbi:V-type proton ATPase subunit S1 [Ixodes scapularis]|uniref:V-type proton ATPase subunit S1 n=1 Tax=Ixodes scapularis TaxID=6945 RepID=UPI001A9FDC36|nr:V-type proton ATPase subunit S1 [Ixodes scapularis]
MALCGMLQRIAVCASIVIFLGVPARSENVPAFLWSSDSHLNKFPQVSSFESIEPSTFSKSMEALLSRDDTLVVAFVQDALSMEDLSKNSADDSTYKYLKSAFEKSPVVVLPSVVDPVDGLSSSAGEARMTRVSVGDPSDVQSALDGLRDRHRLLLVDLPETSGGDRALALQRADDIIKATMQALSVDRKKLIGLYTGHKEVVEESPVRASRSRRHLLAAAGASNLTKGVLEVRSDCLLLFGGRVSASFVPATPAKAPRETVTFNDTLSTKPVVSCSATGANVSFTFPDVGSVKGFKLEMSFQREGSGFQLESLAGFLAGSKALPLQVRDVWWPGGFSFSCASSFFRQFNASMPPQLQVTLDTFQVELSQNATARFSESYDCASFFTTVVWMGFLVVLLYLFILAVGIFFLYDIRTNDRFDDPKEKTITVSATD